MSRNAKRTILISGASIAGPTLAFWLHRYGFEVTLVEKAPAVRGGGYPIDIRGTALGVVRRMGMLPQIEAAHIDSRKLSFLDANGDLIACIRPEVVTGGVEGRDIELRRGDLVDVLYAGVRDSIETIFNDSIATLHDHDGGVDVVFRGGARRTFDLVIGADGLHSHTRSLTFGPEAQFHRYLGRCFAGFTMANDLGLAHEGVSWNVPNRGAVLYAVRHSDRLHAFLTFGRAEPPFTAFADPAAQRDLVASMFVGDGWLVPRMVAAMYAADDLYFDVVSQIHMPRWSSGRVALVGDAAYAPSFLAGAGSSIALVGAYVLAGELATRDDHTAAFAAYEQTLREFVAANQAFADQGAVMLTPPTAEALARRNEALRDPSRALGEQGGRANSMLTLPTYAPPI